MPRAHEYRDGASILRHRSTVFATAAAAYRRLRIDGFAAGPLVDEHSESLSRIAAHLAAGSERLTDLARLCDSRAEVCESYAARLREWERMPIWDRISTPRPTPPAPWADA